jgi:hypothetical protein
MKALSPSSSLKHAPKIPSVSPVEVETSVSCHRRAHYTERRLNPPPTPAEYLVERHSILKKINELFLLYSLSIFQCVQSSGKHGGSVERMELFG